MKQYTVEELGIGSMNFFFLNFFFKFVLDANVFLLTEQ